MTVEMIYCFFDIWMIIFLIKNNTKNTVKKIKFINNAKNSIKLSKSTFSEKIIINY